MNFNDLRAIFHTIKQFLSCNERKDLSRHLCCWQIASQDMLKIIRNL